MLNDTKPRRRDRPGDGGWTVRRVTRDSARRDGSCCGRRRALTTCDCRRPTPPGRSDAAGAPGASVTHGCGYTAAVFPTGPEREFLNNAVLDQQLSATDADVGARRGRRRRYAGIGRYAVWVTEGDQVARRRAGSTWLRRRHVHSRHGARAGRTSSRRCRTDRGPVAWSAYVDYEGVAPDGRRCRRTSASTTALRRRRRSWRLPSASRTTATSASTTCSTHERRVGAGAWRRRSRRSCVNAAVEARQHDRDPAVDADGGAGLRSVRLPHGGADRGVRARGGGLGRDLLAHLDALSERRGGAARGRR